MGVRKSALLQRDEYPQRGLQPFSLPEDFLLGTATASLQIEGGDRNNSWYRWAEEGRIKDGSSPLRACDHWNRYEEDIGLMKQLGCHSYRMSIEWSRIEPSPGAFNPKALDHYRREIGLLRDSGIRPLVTLHHFSNPLWFEDSGGWLHPEAPERFLRYVRYTAGGLRDLVSDWVTINEANIYLVFGYIFGEWPPGKSTVSGYLRGGRNMVKAHLLAYDELHRSEPSAAAVPVLVGAAAHVRVFDPQRDRFIERSLSRIYDRVFQDMFVAAMTDGRRLFPLGLGSKRGSRPAADFLGLNYYSRDMIAFRWKPASLFGEQRVREGAEVNDLGWEIYPQGLYRTAKRYYDQYRLPVFITENGICDRKDSRRPRYILEHLQQVKRLIDDGVDVQRYYHWTLTDNFEWAEGETARFGLIEVDYESQKRSIRRSGELYGELCRNRSADAALIAEYI